MEEPRDMGPHAGKFARAISTAFVADIHRAPSIGRAIERGLGARKLRDIIVRDLEREARGIHGVPLFPNLRAVLRTQMNVESTLLRGGMGEWAELFGAIGGAASKYVTARIGAKTETTFARLEKQREETAIRAEQLAAARARMDLANVQGVPGAAGGDGLPGWVLPAAGGAVVLGAVVYFATRSSGEKRRR